MIRLTVCLFLAFLSGCVSRGSDDEQRAELHLRIGTAHLGKGNYPAALSELLKANELHDESPVINNNLGLAYFVRGKYQLAEKYIRKAVTLEPKYTEARNNLGRALIELGLFDEAIEELNKASEDLTYSAPEKTHANLGLAYFKKRNFAKARDEYKKALAFQPGVCSSANFYARSLLELNDLETAPRAFDLAIKTCEKQNFPEPLYYGAVSYYRKGEREAAMARFNELLAQFPEGELATKAKEMLKIIQ